MTATIQIDKIMEVNVNRFSLRPIICLMIISACYNLKTPRKACLTILLWLYQCTIFLVFVAYIVRNFINLKGSFVNFASNSLITCQCFGNCFISWKSFSTRYGHFNKAMDMWKDCVSQMIQHKLNIDFTYFKRRQSMIVMTIVFLQLISVSAQVVIVFILVPPAEELRSLGFNITFTAPFEDTPGSRIFVALPVCIQIISLTTPAVYLMVISVMLRTGFMALNNHLKHLFRTGNEHALEKLEECRAIHFDLCQVVSKLDQDLCFMYGNIYVWTLAMSIFVLYVIVKFHQSLFEAVIYLFYLGLTLGMLFAMSISAAYVHEEVCTYFTQFCVELTVVFLRTSLIVTIDLSVQLVYLMFRF